MGRREGGKGGQKCSDGLPFAFFIDTRIGQKKFRVAPLWCADLSAVVKRKREESRGAPTTPEQKKKNRQLSPPLHHPRRKGERREKSKRRFLTILYQREKGKKG